MASFPSAPKIFATKNIGDVIQPNDVNDPQDEITAIETGYLNGTARLNSSNSTVVSLSIAGPWQIGNSTTAALSSGNTNDLAISALSVVRLAANSSGSTLTGIAFAGGAADRQMLLLMNISASNLVLAHQTGSVSSGQFICPTNSAFTLRGNGSVWLHYDANIPQWRVVAP